MDIFPLVMVGSGEALRTTNLKSRLEYEKLREPEWCFVDFSCGYESGENLDDLIVNFVALRRIHRSEASQTNRPSTAPVTMFVALPLSERVQMACILGRASGVQVALVGSKEQMIENQDFIKKITSRMIDLNDPVKKWKFGTNILPKKILA